LIKTKERSYKGDTQTPPYNIKMLYIKVFIYITSREEQNLTALKSNSNTVRFNFQTYIYITNIYKNSSTILKSGLIFRRIYIYTSENYVWKLNRTVYIYIYIYISQWIIIIKQLFKNAKFIKYKIPCHLYKYTINSKQ
jgi:hypothetical protein